MSREQHVTELVDSAGPDIPDAVGSEVGVFTSPAGGSKHVRMGTGVTTIKVPAEETQAVCIFYPVQPAKSPCFFRDIFLGPTFSVSTRFTDYSSSVWTYSETISAGVERTRFSFTVEGVRITTSIREGASFAFANLPGERIEHFFVSSMREMGSTGEETTFPFAGLRPERTASSSGERVFSFMRAMGWSVSLSSSQQREREKGHFSATILFSPEQDPLVQQNFLWIPLF